MYACVYMLCMHEYVYVSAVFPCSQLSATLTMPHQATTPTATPTPTASGRRAQSSRQSSRFPATTATTITTNTAPIYSRSSSRESVHRGRGGGKASQPSSPTPAKPSSNNIRLHLLCFAEKFLTELDRKISKGKAGAERLEVKVHLLLGLAEVAMCVEQRVTAYRLSLQALRLLQVAEEAGGRGLLRELDARLWLECRYLICRSVVGLEAWPGGGAILLEVGEWCAECRRLKEVELGAGLELAAAEHALTLVPCQLEAALQHSQVSA